MAGTRRNPLTAHAAERVRERKLSLDAIDAACLYGTRRRRDRRGSRTIFYTIDPAAVRRARHNGVDLARWLWIEVIVTAPDGRVVTCYRLAPALRRRYELRGGPADNET